jgi:hypothetical protein
MDSLPRFKLVAEAARELRKGERWLRDWLKRHPVDRDGLRAREEPDPFPTDRRPRITEIFRVGLPPLAAIGHAT